VPGVLQANGSVNHKPFSSSDAEIGMDKDNVS
jgi:hypothetical protein